MGGAETGASEGKAAEGTDGEGAGGGEPELVGGGAGGVAGGGGGAPAGAGEVAGVGGAVVAGASEGGGGVETMVPSEPSVRSREWKLGRLHLRSSETITVPVAMGRPGFEAVTFQVPVPRYAW